MSNAKRMILGLIAFGFSLLLAAQSAAQGKPVEDLEIRGNRSVSSEEILKRVKTKPGEPYQADQVKRDFEQVMEMGVFDKLRSSVIIETGVRHGVVVIFMLEEIPKQKPSSGAG
jgi:outer membrane protein assembly factor BamA